MLISSKNVIAFLIKRRIILQAIFKIVDFLIICSFFCFLVDGGNTYILAKQLNFFFGDDFATFFWQQNKKQWPNTMVR